LVGKSPIHIEANLMIDDIMGSGYSIRVLSFVYLPTRCFMTYNTKLADTRPPRFLF
jgi:hypothetical protein